MEEEFSTKVEFLREVFPTLTAQDILNRLRRCHDGRGHLRGDRVSLVANIACIVHPLLSLLQMH